MKTNANVLKTIAIIGTICFIIGAIDPLEGSILIFIGAILIALEKYLKHDVLWKWFTAIAVSIIIGVAFLFYFSSLGGFGAGASLSWWWAMLILPYPIGWLSGISLLIYKAVKNKPRALIFFIESIQ